MEEDLEQHLHRIPQSQGTELGFGLMRSTELCLLELSACCW